MTKRIIALALALLMLAVLCACGKTGDSGSTASNGGNGGNGGTVSQSGNGGENENSNGGSGNGGNVTPASLTGKLNIIDLEDRDPSVLRGVTIKGTSVGLSGGFNDRESSLTDVRCIFELGEWIEFYPDTDATYGIKVWILRHRDDQEYYNTAKFSDLDPNFANYCDLHYPEDNEEPDNWYWGNFFLHEEECEPGYYDFVFTYEGKAIAVLVTRFYNVGEIAGKSDAELEKLMHE